MRDLSISSAAKIWALLVDDINGRILAAFSEWKMIFLLYWHALTPSPIANTLTILKFLKLRFTKMAYMSIIAREKLHIICKPVAATR